MRVFEKVSRLLKYDSEKKFCTHINIYMDTNTDYFTLKIPVKTLYVDI